VLRVAQDSIGDKLRCRMGQRPQQLLAAPAALDRHSGAGNGATSAHVRTDGAYAVLTKQRNPKWPRESVTRNQNQRVAAEFSPNDAVVGKSNNPKSRVGSKQEKVRGLLRHHGALLGRRRLYARPHRTCRSEHQHGTWPYGPICQDGEQSLCLTYPRLRLSMKAASAKAVHCAICTRVSPQRRNA
jgi:hypothetical protein